MENPLVERGREHDLGKGFTLTEALVDGTLIGYFVTGPAAEQCRSSYEGRCGGLCPVTPVSFTSDRKPRHVWGVSGEWPEITLTPSVACNCGGQHSYVRDGRWA